MGDRHMESRVNAAPAGAHAYSLLDSYIYGLP
jgi:hypothetical protein